MCRQLRELVKVLLENDPDDFVADGGVTVLDAWRKRAEALLKKASPEPVAWMYELALKDELGNYCDWERRISRRKPIAPEGSIRDLRPLYAGDPE